MSWKLEIYRAFFVAFGMFQIIANTRYLSITDGINLAAKQHQEIPKAASRKQLRIKVIFMLTFGCIFFTLGFSSYIFRSVNEMYYSLVLILFALYAVGEGLYYRYWKTIGFSIVSILVLIIFIY